MPPEASSALRQLRSLMRACTILFVGTGLIFLLGGEEMLRAINWLAVKIKLAEVDPAVELASRDDRG